VKLINDLEPDIKYGMDSDISGRSYKAAKELSKFGESAIPFLSKSLPRSSYAHYALGLIGIF
jgi:hypothetical protein